jgi:F-type H+-transporting ATPase subunit b
MLFVLIYIFDSGEIMQWLNYPGLELWKFINLAIFLGAGIFILRRPLAAALATRRESIRRELLSAQKERDEALARLAEAEALLERLDADVTALQEEARIEADLERKRLKDATDRELEKLRLQAQRDIEMAVKVARLELRRFLAERSIQIATEAVVRELGPEDDARLINAGIGELRRRRV